MLQYSSHSTPPSDDEVLVRVEGVSKKFCRSLKKSLWYGVCDIASELNPFGRNTGKLIEYNHLTTIEHGGRCEKEQPKVGPKGERVGTSESKGTESTTEQRGRCEMEQSQIGSEGEGAGATESRGGAGLCLSGQAGAAFSNPTTSGLAVDSQITSLARAASNPCSSGENALDALLLFRSPCGRILRRQGCLLRASPWGMFGADWA